MCNGKVVPMVGSVKLQVEVKIDSAKDIRRQIEAACLRHLEKPDERDSLKMGSLLGNFANDLRSALNYTMRFYVDHKLKSLITSDEFRDVKKKRGHDFPWAEHENDFETKPVIIHTKQHFPAIYRLLEQNQPFRGVVWLKQFMRISNDDKHVKINVVAIPKIVGMAAGVGINPIRLPKIIGNALVVNNGPMDVKVYSLPCYFAPLHAFATESGWRMFFLEVDEGQLKEVLPFADFLIRSVEQLVTDFEALL